MSKYSEKFKDPRWQKRRLEVLERDEWTCRICGDTESTLNVHHRHYRKNADPWDYEDCLLVTLCEECHKNEHDEMPKALDSLGKAVVSAGYTSEDIWSISLGFAQHAMPHDPDVSATVIEFALSEPYVMWKLTELYFKKLKSTSKKGESDGSQKQGV